MIDFFDSGFIYFFYILPTILSTQYIVLFMKYSGRLNRRGRVMYCARLHYLRIERKFQYFNTGKD